jgi:hypothetical protein
MEVTSGLIRTIASIRLVRQPKNKASGGGRKPYLRVSGKFLTFPINLLRIDKIAGLYED